MQDRKKVTRSEWRRICIQLNKWCTFEEIEGMTYKQALLYIKSIQCNVKKEAI